LQNAEKNAKSNFCPFFNIACVHGRSYKRDATEKLKMSNGEARDVYLSNSRRTRNNDKPVDNNVFTDRLPVSTGPQHHQWQQHQQLLMQAAENVFADELAA